MEWLMQEGREFQASYSDIKAAVLESLAQGLLVNAVPIQAQDRRWLSCTQVASASIEDPVIAERAGASTAYVWFTVAEQNPRTGRSSK